MFSLGLNRARNSTDLRQVEHLDTVTQRLTPNVREVANGLDIAPDAGIGLGWETA